MMKRLVLTLCIVLSADILGPRESRAQVIETPVAFDSAGRVRVITPPLVARLRLEPPVWPVTGDFTEARLFARGDAAYVLVVQRAKGTLERFELSSDAGARLRAAVSIAMQTAGRPTTDERADVISEPARGAFVRNQTALGAGVYGPSLAILSNDARSATAILLLTTGGTFFLSYALVKNEPVSRAQNFLATDGAVRGAVAAAGLTFAIGGKGPGIDEYAAAVFGGSVAGSITGFLVGKPLTDGEAQAMSLGSTTMAATTLGLLGTTGVLQETNTINKARAITAAVVGASIVGYPVGLTYPRRASYTVTAGDVDMTSLTSTLGTATGLGIALLPRDLDSRTKYGLATAGYLGGLVLGDRLLARRYDHTEADAELIGLGVTAGTVIGWATVEPNRPVNDGVYVLVPTVGGILGLILTERLVEPRRADQFGARVGSSLRLGSSPRAPTVELSPSNALLAAAKMPGYHSLVRIRF